MFERSLQALIRGLRSHRGKDEARYVASVLDEVRAEVKSGDMEVKAEAVLKLAYLQMLGYQALSTNFHIVETMASPKFHIKFTGYLAASLCFSKDTDVLILATNLIKKDLHSGSPLDVAAALNGLSHIITQELAQHLAADINTMLTHSRASIRKRALLVLYSAILKYPDILEQTWERLRDRLDDPDAAVVTAAVNVVCELARRNPAPFVPLSPQLFRILETATNNWLLIKVIKLFGALAPYEPRLVRKLVPPISNIITTTPAMSLMYECIHSLIVGDMLRGDEGDALARQCIGSLARFLSDSDQNLKYIALLALVKMLPSHAHLVAQYRDDILDSIHHPDMTIRLRSLDLACGLASRANLQQVMHALLTFLLQGEGAAPSRSTAAQALHAALRAPGPTGADTPAAATRAQELAAFRVQVAESMLDLGAADGFANVQSMDEYIDTLIELGRLADVDVGERVAEQLVDIAQRFPRYRASMSRRMQELAWKEHALLYDPHRSSCQLLRAVAWICGEYGAAGQPAALDAVLFTDDLRGLPPDVVAVVIHSGMKLFSQWVSSLSDDYDASSAAQLH